jgi:hypothetical protein
MSCAVSQCGHYISPLRLSDNMALSDVKGGWRVTEAKKINKIAILKASLEPLTLFGMVTSAISLTSIITKYGQIDFHGIAADCLHYYKGFFHEKVDHFVSWVCGNFSIPLFHIPDILKDMSLFALMVLMVWNRQAMVLRKLSFKVRGFGYWSYIETIFQKLDDRWVHSSGSFVGTPKEFDFILRFVYLVQIVCVLITVMAFIFWGTYS